MATETTTGERIRRYRTIVRMDVERLAEAARIATPRLYEIERGTAEPTRGEIIALALTLGVDANDLRDGTTTPMAFPDGLSTDEKIDLIFAGDDD